MLVSVIIPCYRNSATLGRAIKSVVSQTYGAIEIIVVNDNSPETTDIDRCLSEFPFVVKVVNPINLGPSASRNIGISLARGELIAFLDADDEYVPEKIARQVEVIKPGMIVTCGFTRVYPDRQERVHAGVDRLISKSSSIFLRNSLNGAGLMATKDQLLNIGGYDESLGSCEDFDLYLRFLHEGTQIKVIGSSLYRYHFSPLGLSNNLENISKWEIELIRRHASRIGNLWQSSWKYKLMMTSIILRHLFRLEKSHNIVFRENVKSELELLRESPLIWWFLAVLFYSRIMKVLVILIDIKKFIFRSKF